MTPKGPATADTPPVYRKSNDSKISAAVSIFPDSLLLERVSKGIIKAMTVLGKIRRCRTMSDGSDLSDMKLRLLLSETGPIAGLFSFRRQLPGDGRDQANQ